MLAMFGTTISPESKGGDESKSFWREYSLLIGLSILVFILIFLLTTTEQLYSSFSHISLIDSELSSVSENETPVLTKLDMSSSEGLRGFPTEIGDWKGYDYETSSLEEYFQADCMLMRAYSKPGLYQPIFLLVMQSRVQSSFHPPVVCYPALGWSIEEEGKEGIPVAPTDWTTETPSDVWPSVAENPEYGEAFFRSSVPAKRLVVYQQSAEEVTERRVVLYFYMKENKLTSRRVTMIRVSALAPLSGSYDGILGIEKEFVTDVFPYMFEVQQRTQEHGQPIIVYLVKSGVAGQLFVAFLFSIPLAILIYPRVRRPSATAKEETRDNT